MAGTGEGPLTYSAGYRRTVLTLLVVAYTLNFVDRTIVASIGQAIKADLKISDTQLGLLGGLYFALLYTFLGIPLARLAERYSRVNIIAGAVLLWSGFTALCGIAGSYATLALYRFGVGVGEAGLSPPAHSLLSDLYPPQRRASALSLYSLGVPVGTLVGLIAGTWLAQHYSWRVAFMAVGLPGVFVAFAVRALVKEPVRGGSEPGASRTAAPPPSPSLGHELRELGTVTRLLLGRWPVLNMVIGVTLVSFAGYGGGQFLMPYWLRAFPLTQSQAGAIVGLVGAGSQVIGVVLGGLLADRLARGGAARWYGLVPALGVVLAYPFIVGMFTAPTWRTAAIWLAFPGIFSYAYMGPTWGVVQNAFPPARRATAMAVVLLVLNLVALGGGPPLTGWLIDHFAAFHFAHAGAPGLGSALRGLWSADARAFGVACPGGAGPPGDAVRDHACKAAVLLATRQGEVLAYAVGLWGALHYVIASFGIGRVLTEARVARGEAA